MIITVIKQVSGSKLNDLCLAILRRGAGRASSGCNSFFWFFRNLKYDARRQLVQGKIAKEATYHYTLTAITKLDTLVQKITLVVKSDMVSPTPAMSWISWNVYDCKVNEEKILRTADKMKSLGLADLGWNYIVIDDTWQAGNDNVRHREADGTPKADATKFPHGMKYVTDYIHKLGLRAGIYSDSAASTCGGYIGSYGRETIDANVYAKWGFDFLKYDYCNTPQDSATAKVRYAAICKALDETGRPFFLNVCEWAHLCNTSDTQVCLNTQGLAPGFYLIRTICDGVAQSRKVRVE